MIEVIGWFVAIAAMMIAASMLGAWWAEQMLRECGHGRRRKR